MSYSSKIQEWDEDSRNRQTATKIIDSMRKLRQNPKSNSYRRWIWELMQNAKDVAFENDTVSIEICFNKSEEEGFLEFKHNGKPFTIKNLIFLVNQVSAKDRDNSVENNKITGKFGTGFLTTHLLSEKVNIEGVVQEDSEPYKKVSLTLDRSSRSIDDIINSVKKSRTQISEIDNNKSYNEYNKSNYNTTFKYFLDKKGIEVAEQGIDDLHKSLIFTLAFLPEIGKVHLTHEGTCFQLNPIKEIINENFYISTIEKITFSSKETLKVAVLKKGQTSIAIELEKSGEKISLKEFESSTPKLFCDFPLIGSEMFPFPVIINSSSFNPTEPRDCVMLTDIEDDEILENKSLVADAVELYKSLLLYATKENWDNVKILALMPNNLERDWIDKNWYEKNVRSSLQECILNASIVDTTNNNRISILNESGDFNAFFPAGRSEELRKEIWNLSAHWVPNRLPLKEDIEFWTNIRWLEVPQLTLDFLSTKIEKQNNMENLSEKLIDISSIHWLNKYFKILEHDPDFLKEVNGDAYCVIPNQHGNFKSSSKLKIDNGIEEELKNVLLMLGEDCREYLRSKELDAQNIIHINKEQDEIIFEINRHLKNRKKDIKNIAPIHHYLASLFSKNNDLPKNREDVYFFCRSIFPSDFTHKRHIIKWSEEIWQEVDKFELVSIIKIISSCGNLAGLAQRLQLEKNLTVEWLADFISFLKSSGNLQMLTHKNAIILPNQNGKLLQRDHILLDDGEIDETLKDISAMLGFDYRNELLDTNIFLELPENRIIDELSISKEILNRITPLFSEIPRTQATNDIFKELSKWFARNSEKASMYFKGIHVHKLIKDEELVESIEKAEKYDELEKILLEHDIKDYEELMIRLETQTVQVKESLESSQKYEKILQKYGFNGNDLEDLLKSRISSEAPILEKEELTEDLLIQSGIYSSSELERAMENKWFSEHFIHTSDSKSYKYHYIQKRLNDSKESVLNYLMEVKKEYNFEDMTEIDKTIFLVTKNDKETYLIIRPSNCDQIIIHYDSEKDILDYEKDWEIWVVNVDEKNSIPQQISLGKILKITGINRIPLKKLR